MTEDVAAIAAGLTKAQRRRRSAMPTEPDIERIAAGLTKAQRAMVRDSEPGGFGREDEACGAEVIGIGRLATARALERQQLGTVDWYPFAYPPYLYFNNHRGLAVRARLLASQTNETKETR